MKVKWLVAIFVAVFLGLATPAILVCQVGNAHLLSEQFKFEFRAEPFNLFNHPMFGQPNSLMGPGGNSGPAVISSVISQPRIIQLAMKLHF